VYRWINKVNDAYIGSATDLTRRLRYYFSSYFLFKEILNNSIMYRALLKHGYSKFTLEILECCDKSYVIEK